MYLRLLLIGALAAGVALAQEEGAGPAPAGGGGGGGRGGGSSAPAVPKASASPLERMATACSLSKDQTKQFNSILTAASKSAAPLREQIPASRKELEAAAQAGKSPDELKKLEESSGLAMAQMTQIEMNTFGELYKILDANQRRTGAQRIFNSLGGMFMKKNWNE